MITNIIKSAVTTVLLLFTISNVNAQSLDSLFNGSKNGGALPVEEAFPIDILENKDNINLIVDVVSGHYLYTDKIEVTINNEMKDIKIPNTEFIYDEFFGKVEIVKYGFGLDFDYGTEDKEINFKLDYQGCSKVENICYPPTLIEKTFKNPNYIESVKKEQVVKAKEVEKIKIEDKLNGNIVNDIYNLATTNSIKTITDFLNNNNNTFFVSLIFIGMGFFIAFTPCIYPLMPIIVASTSKAKNKKIASLSYVFGMIMAYSSIGLMVGFLNLNMQILTQNPIFTYGISIFLILAGFFTLGYFNNLIPNSMNNKLNEKIMNIEEDKYSNQAIIGFLSTLIVSPCSIAPLLGVLVFISQMNAPFYGSYLLGMLGLGIGIPLFLLSTSLSKFLPKNGAWMNEVKNLIAVVMFIMATYLMSRQLGDNLVNISYSLIAFFYGSYLLGLNMKYKFGLILMISSVLFLFKTNFAENNKQNLQQISTNETKLNYTIVEDIDTLNELIISTNKPVFVDFYADWCITCVRLENNVLNKKNVINYLNDNFLMLKIDLTKISKSEKELMKERSILAVPYYLFVNKEKKETIYTGELSKDNFLKVLNLTNK